MWDYLFPSKPYRLVAYVIPDMDRDHLGEYGRNPKFHCSSGFRHFSTLDEMLRAARGYLLSSEALVYSVEGFKHTGDAWTPVGVLQ
jgi:hypothetical protein